MTAQPPAAHVLVVEDDRAVAAAVRRALEYAGFAVTVTHDGPSALAHAARFAPDVVVLDLGLPGLDGLAVCQALRGLAWDHTAPMVLMLTARDSTADRVAGLDAGADDYLVKPFAFEELQARVRALLRRRPATTAPGLAIGDLTIDPAAREVRRNGREITLTALEFDLLAYFVRHPRHVLSRDQVLQAVWGGGSAATSNVVDVYVGYLRAKLEAGGEPRMLHTVRGAGYVLRAVS
ncbi:two-component system response regulator MprA [Allocatelliglobosispora scoriae]|uniref:Two-component system response regulator MprA n=1 Tax=Allocatelliglobosispora scoriae TaxID=643052 RepID=A0A841C2H1_9ACTN|nr:response regulator transcription factor [Allocatelliglobosispora scoriae]MBB5873958.1 two-component system response regulator MprA [Allocatelliglobosispora scoriae]